MSKSMIKKRKIAILSGCSPNQIKTTLILLNRETGVIKTSYDSQDNSILFEYDLIKVIYSDIEDIVISQKMCKPTGFKNMLRTTWFDYLDTTARDNALAPPAACCNKPPRRIE